MQQINNLRVLFAKHVVEGGEDWRIGKGLQKLARVDRSIIEDQNRFDRVKLMIKNEVYTQTFVNPKNIKKARGIQFPPNERSAYEFAAESHAFSHAFSDLTSDFIEHCGITFQIRYSANMTHAEIGEYASACERHRIRFRVCYIDERDGVNWDANVQYVHRRAVISVYRRLDVNYARYMERGLNVRGSYTSKDGVRVLYNSIGTVKSGHPDTSSGNSLLNRDISIQAIVSLPEHLRPREVRGMVMGDDYIGWLYYDNDIDPCELANALNGNERRLGIEPIRGLFSDLRCASYISLGFYRMDNGDFAALPKIGRHLCRLFWTVTDLRGRDPKRLAAGVAAAFYPLYSTYPPMRAFLRYHMQVDASGIGDLQLQYRWQELGMKRLPGVINWSENHAVKYGTEALLLDFTGLFDGEQCARLCHSHIVDLMYSVDVSDPCDRPGCVSA